MKEYNNSICFICFSFSFIFHSLEHITAWCIYMACISATFMYTLRLSHLARYFHLLALRYLHTIQNKIYIGATNRIWRSHDLLLLLTYTIFNSISTNIRRFFFHVHLVDVYQKSLFQLITSKLVHRIVPFCVQTARIYCFVKRVLLHRKTSYSAKYISIPTEQSSKSCETNLLISYRQNLVLDFTSAFGFRIKMI